MPTTSAPSARRKPISPTRSSTETRVTLAIPIAPTNSDTAPNTRNSAFTSLSTWVCRLSGDGGDCTRTSAGIVGRHGYRSLRSDQSRGPDLGIDLDSGRRFEIVQIPCSTFVWVDGGLRPIPPSVLGVPLEPDELSAGGIVSAEGTAELKARGFTVHPGLVGDATGRRGGPCPRR